MFFLSLFSHYLKLSEFPHYCHASDLVAIYSPDFERKQHSSPFSASALSSPSSTPNSTRRHHHHSHAHCQHYLHTPSASSSKLFAASLSRSREKAQKNLGEMSAETRQLQTPSKRKFVLHKMSSTCSFETASPIPNSSAPTSAIATPKTPVDNEDEAKKDSIIIIGDSSDRTTLQPQSAMDSAELNSSHSIPQPTVSAHPTVTLQRSINIEYDHTPTKLQGKTSSSHEHLPHDHHSHPHHRHSAPSHHDQQHRSHHQPHLTHESQMNELHLDGVDLNSEGIEIRLFFLYMFVIDHCIEFVFFIHFSSH
jgi:hypothetical protein